MLLVVDNGSLHTKNLIDFLSDKKINFAHHTYNNISISSLNKFKSFILSGRKKNNHQMNLVNSKIIKHTVSEKKSLLGICYGAEILALTLGGTIMKMNFPKKGTQKVIIIKKNPLCSGTINVYESHSFRISRLTEQFSVVAKSICENEFIQYSDMNIFGTQFHPEMTKDGQLIITKFCALNSFNNKRKSKVHGTH